MKKPKKSSTSRQKRPTRPTAEPTTVLSDRRAMEKEMAGIARLLQEREFESIEEVNHAPLASASTPRPAANRNE